MSAQFFNGVQVGCHDNHSGGTKNFIRLDLLQEFHARDVGEMDIQQDKTGYECFETVLRFFPRLNDPCFVFALFQDSLVKFRQLVIIFENKS